MREGYCGVEMPRTVHRPKNIRQVSNKKDAKTIEVTHDDWRHKSKPNPKVDDWSRLSIALGGGFSNL